MLKAGRELAELTELPKKCIIFIKIYLLRISRGSYHNIPSVSLIIVGELFRLLCIRLTEMAKNYRKRRISMEK